MKKCMITFRTVMPAQRGDGVLRLAGISGRLSRTPVKLAQKGCGYSLYIPCEDVVRAAQVLRQNRIPFQKAYLLQQEDQAEELEL